MVNSNGDLNMIAKIEWFGILTNLSAYMLMSQGFIKLGFIIGGFGCVALVFTSYKAKATKFILLNGAFLIINLLGVFHNV
jgi:hypothetical protein